MFDPTHIRSVLTKLAASPWLRDRRGTVAIEYIAIVGTIALLAIPAAIAVGKALVDSFGITREMLFYPVP